MGNVLRHLGPRGDSAHWYLGPTTTAIDSLTIIEPLWKVPSVKALSTLSSCRFQPGETTSQRRPSRPILLPSPRPFSSSRSAAAAYDALTTSEDRVDGSGKAELISKAMKAYIERARKEGRFMKQQTAEYELGKRHLARIMGKDPTLDFTQKDIESAISYLFPSGLFSPYARPFMDHPSKIFPKKKAPQFGWDGRPFHPLFYTGKPNFNQILHDGRALLERVVETAAAERKSAASSSDESVNDRERAIEGMKVFVNSTRWMSKDTLRALLLEKVNDRDYDRFVNLGDRILDHQSASYLAKEFLSPYREPIGELVNQRLITEPYVDAETGVRYSIGAGENKCTKAEVILREGTGVILINGQDIDFYDSVGCRLQLLTPLAFLGRVGDFDLEADVQGPDNAYMSSAKAIRIALCRALTAFCTPTEVENMRLAGLLTQDPRVRERKLPGQKAARAKFKWKKR